MMSDLPVSQAGPSEPPRPEGLGSRQEQDATPDEGGPLSRRFSAPLHAESVRSLRRSEPPLMGDPLSRRAAIEAGPDGLRPTRLSEPPFPNRTSEPPPSMSPFSARMFEGPLSAGPLSDAALMSGPLSLRIARVSREAGPGYRISPGSRAVLLKVDGHEAILYEVDRLSPVAIWFAAEDYASYEKGAALVVHLSSQDAEIGPLRATVVSIEPSESGSGMLVGVQIPVISLSVGRRVLGVLRALVALGLAEPARSLSMTQESIEDADRIHSIVTTLITRGGEGILRGPDATVHAIRLEKEGPGAIVWQGSVPWGEPPHIVDMVGFGSIQRLRIGTSEARDGEVLTSLPSHVERVRHRWFRRCVVQGEVMVRYSHPLWPELGIVERRVRDVSFAGIGFESIPEEDLGFPGLELADIVVIPEDGVPIHLRGQIRFVSAPKGGATSLCGMRVTPGSPEDEARWRILIGREMHATTDTSSDQVQSLWALFEQSGYFNLSGKSPDQFEQIKQSFFALGRRASSAPALFCQVVWPSGRGIEASGSVLKAYDGTWLTHQLAKRSGRGPGNIDPRQVMRDIYFRGLEHMQSDPDFRWVLAYLEAHVVWSKRAHLEFAARYQEMGLALVLPFRLREGSSVDTSGLSFNEFEISEATYEETEQLLGILRCTHPLAYTEALDLVPDRFGMELISRSWKGIGVERERELLIARRNGAAVAAAVLETGETGTNLFRLLDAVRVFSMRTGGESAFVALLDAARGWYAARSKSTFTVFDEHQDGKVAELAKLRDLGDGNLWAISSLLLPEFLEHIYELTAPRRR